MHLNYKHFFVPLYQGTKCRKSQLFLYIKQKFLILVHLDGFHNIYSGFNDKPKKKKKNWKICQVVFFSKFRKSEIAVR